MPERVIRFKEWFRFNGSYYLTPTRSSSIRFNYSKMVRYTATRCGHYIYMYGSRSGEQDGIQHLVRFDKKTYEWHLLNDLQPKEFAPPPTLKEYRLVTYGSDVILIGTTCSKTCQWYLTNANTFNQVVWGRCHYAPAPLSRFSWTASSWSVSPRTNFSAVIAAGPYVYIFGGLMPSPSNDLFRCDVTDDGDGSPVTIPETPSTPGPRFDHMTAQVSESGFVVFGGRSKFGVRNDVYFFDALTELWQPICMESRIRPPPLLGASMMALNSQEVLLHGGVYRNEVQNTFYRLDINREKWSIIHPKNRSMTSLNDKMAVSHHSLVSSPPSFLWFGGYDSQFKIRSGLMSLNNVTESGQKSILIQYLSKIFNEEYLTDVMFHFPLVETLKEPSNHHNQNSDSENFNNSNDSSIRESLLDCNFETKDVMKLFKIPYYREHHSDINDTSEKNDWYSIKAHRCIIGARCSSFHRFMIQNTVYIEYDETEHINVWHVVVSSWIQRILKSVQWRQRLWSDEYFHSYLKPLFTTEKQNIENNSHNINSNSSKKEEISFENIDDLRDDFSEGDNNDSLFNASPKEIIDVFQSYLRFLYTGSLHLDRPSLVRHVYYLSQRWNTHAQEIGCLCRRHKGVYLDLSSLIHNRLEADMVSLVNDGIHSDIQLIIPDKNNKMNTNDYDDDGYNDDDMNNWNNNNHHHNNDNNKMNQKKKNKKIQKQKNDHPKSIYAHKVLLSRSNYFKLMFHTGLEESRADVIDLSLSLPGDEIDATSLIDIIRHIYTDQNIVTSNNCIPMLIYSRFLNLNQLEHYSQYFIRSMLNVENVVPVFKIARDFKVERLEKSCLLFMRKHHDSDRIADDIQELEPKLAERIQQIMKSSRRVILKQQ
eukprot:gb/GECH01010923.1/.p1 GENE.gb/GECH01010923.1/~~gb/GECH01010923.1/.p1  ORF type:complete len:875 (+),score=206.03 gb/GECH01010923.1/:1-2625(+)